MGVPYEEVRDRAAKLSIEGLAARVEVDSAGMGGSGGSGGRFSLDGRGAVGCNHQQTNMGMLTWLSNNSQSDSEKLMLLTIAFALSFRLPDLFLPRDFIPASVSLVPEASFPFIRPRCSFDNEVPGGNTSLLGDGMHPSLPWLSLL